MRLAATCGLQPYSPNASFHVLKLLIFVPVFRSIYIWPPRDGGINSFTRRLTLISKQPGNQTKKKLIKTDHVSVVNDEEVWSQRGRRLGTSWLPSVSVFMLHSLSPRKFNNPCYSDDKQSNLDICGADRPLLRYTFQNKKFTTFILFLFLIISDFLCSLVAVVMIIWVLLVVLYSKWHHPIKRPHSDWRASRSRLKFQTKTKTLYIKE